MRGDCLSRIRLCASRARLTARRCGDRNHAQRCSYRSAAERHAGCEHRAPARPAARRCALSTFSAEPMATASTGTSPSAKFRTMHSTGADANTSAPQTATAKKSSANLPARRIQARPVAVRRGDRSPRRTARRISRRSLIMPKSTLNAGIAARELHEQRRRAAPELALQPPFRSEIVRPQISAAPCASRQVPADQVIASHGERGMASRRVLDTRGGCGEAQHPVDRTIPVPLAPCLGGARAWSRVAGRLRAAIGALNSRIPVHAGLTCGNSRITAASS